MVHTLECFENDEIQQILVDIAKENGFEKPKFEITAATKPGDNFVGLVIRAIVRENGKEPLPLIFKIAPFSKIRRDSFRSGLLFTNEGAMYNHILPTLNDFLKEHGIATAISAPRCVRSRITEDWKENGLDILVLEDMSAKEYRTVERSVTLDANQCRAILHQLALLHAASLALRKLRPEEAQKTESVLKDCDPDELETLMAGVIPLLESKMYLVEDKYPVGSPEHAKLKDFIDNYPKKVTEVFLGKRNDIDCITHGDCWSNNVLFKFDKEGQVEDIRLIDFQCARVISPASDLLYLLYTCTTKETRDAHYDSLLRDYHQKVSATLKTLGCDPETTFPWSTLQDHIRRHAPFGLVKALFTVPLFTADSSEVPANWDTFMDESSSGTFTEIFTAVNTSSRLDECKERVCDVFQLCLENGYI